MPPRRKRGRAATAAAAPAEDVPAAASDDGDDEDLREIPEGLHIGCRLRARAPRFETYTFPPSDPSPSS
jgi:hypothetical protein